MSSSEHSRAATQEALPHEGFPIVGIGASAGGLEAFIELLQNLPPGPGLALVLVQHLDPTHESRLPEILARATSLPVRPVVDGARVERDTIFVIPPNHGLFIESGRLMLTPRGELQVPFMPIDLFFRSLARDQGKKAIGVVLSGGGTDGALGLEEIKGANGIVFVQAENTAQHESMPRSAISTGCADFVLPPPIIARELGRLGRDLLAPDGIFESADLGGDAARLPEIFRLLRRTTNVDFSQYKRVTTERRIRRRMALAGIDTLEEYEDLLESRPVEVQALFQDLLIRVTRFFRDPEAFEALSELVLPGLLDGRAPEETVRLWVAGCSTGEEAYSLAMVLLEALGTRTAGPALKILATDINEVAIERARKGEYVDNIALDVSAPRLRRFFSMRNGKYRIDKAVRDLCVFSRHDVGKDPPFANMDLISCRNLLIYLEKPLQDRVLPFLHYGLRAGGALMIGASESLARHSELFQVRSEEHGLYVKKQGARRARIDPPLEGGASTLRDHEGVAPLGSELDPDEAMKEADRLLLARYSPPGIIVDENLAIVHFRGKVGPFLKPAAGTASLDLVRLMRDSLVIDLRDAVHRARAGNSSVELKGLKVPEHGSLREVDAEVLPLRGGDKNGRHFLILFGDAAPFEELPSIVPPPRRAARMDESILKARIARLDHELATVRGHLQSVIEDNAAAGEELKSANEEILSSNEDLHSTNEQLQTAHEEMQSANEELITVNDELQHRNVELDQLNDDLTNLLGGLNIPLILVNRELRIRKYTPQAETMFNLIPGDVGRPVGDLRPNLDVPDLVLHLDEVVRTLASKNLDVQDEDGRWHSVRLRPYVTTDNRVEGAVLAVLDIDEVRRADEELKISRNYAEAIVETVWEPLVVLDPELCVQRGNPAFHRLFGMSRQEAEGRPIFEQRCSQATHDRVRAALVGVLPDDSRVRDLEIEADLGSSGTRSLLLNAQRIFWEGSSSHMVLLAIEDITDRKHQARHERLLAAEQAARAQAEAENLRKDEFLAMLAHELRNPLAPIRNTLYIMRQRASGDELSAHALEISERQIGHMTRLLDDLLDVARITRGKIQLQPELLELQSVVTRALESCSPQFEERGHQLEVFLPREPVFLEADAARLEQILCNLLINAAKYTPPGGEIAVSIAAEGKWVEIEVADEGIGISADMLLHVFDPFAQASGRPLDRSEGGLGIGLTLVRNLVRLHGGDVKAFSEGLGMGSQFVVRLPCLEGLASGGEHGPGARAPEPGPSRHVLLVEDNADSATSQAMALRLMGHEVCIAHDGREALAAAAAERPDVVLLDIGLPGMSGYEVAAELRRLPGFEAVTVIAVTGYGQEKDRQRAKEAGIDQHLIKPVDLGKLLDVLRCLPTKKA